MVPNVKLAGVSPAAVSREAAPSPHLNSNFLVDIGYGDARDSAAGFCEVVFPEFDIDAVEAGAAAPTSRQLILRRGVTGALDLYSWWDKARRGKAPQRRTVTIQLLAADLASVVLTWRFRHARPVSLSYSALNAMQGAVLIESIALEFDSMEMR